ncbi:bifunctional diaminohydroxyphosphoribosylaminopyrimidine deaminase/5-amino-6-(5-phosphoribosylamino)uracil reductase RibD [Aureimonas sp. AU12]|uniref:bifunctional diaminohydroxyphosphoribosylaminopyrimidine deaminase/5-amino-6-(5-phosphoribosylamino)uracil reductase RibD n=1 Tax=Aureimonas sp. AU12 TaxID=1638161 RepID=UPI000781BA64|nr:bifunctional diaminohydroxyphosphoribosylaminopyrimidine deaminase/5-amino-6-(5-phosphoribosylamino)uracil reductase RibD [Aureimonas sp. AU12]
MAAEDDERYLAAAVRLSRRHVGQTAENPCVGTLIVADTGGSRHIVGRGVTADGGRPHSERVALSDAGDAAQGAVAYVTLEPCAHHGRTGPCATALAEAGIGRVVIGADDPDSRVDGRGRRMLREAGVAAEDRRDGRWTVRPFEGFLSRIRLGRPFVTLKMAVSADGCVGRIGEGQVAISGPISNRQTHLVRAESDAILVAIGTALADDPMLTCRLPGLADRSPVRIIVDRHLRLPLGSRLVQTAREVPVVIATAVDPHSLQAAPYLAAGCRLLPFGVRKTDLGDLLRQLLGLGISTVLVEGGPTFAASLLAAGFVDRAIVVRGTTTIGGAGVAAPAGLLHLEDFARTRQDRFGPDVWSEYERI